MVDLPRIDVGPLDAHRLINSKFPPIALFDDVADEQEFEALYQLQSLTNPRLQNEIGNLGLLPAAEIPFGIDGCSYATAPFTHVNPDGSRFSDGSFGVLYLADELETAVAEVSYHQALYLRNLKGLHFDRLVFRHLICTFAATGVADASTLSMDDAIHHPSDYSAGRSLGTKLWQARTSALQYCSVRRKGARCWGLFTPRPVRRIIQASHLELIWDGRDITGVHRLTEIA